MGTVTPRWEQSAAQHFMSCGGGVSGSRHERALPQQLAVTRSQTLYPVPALWLRASGTTVTMTFTVAGN